MKTSHSSAPCARPIHPRRRSVHAVTAALLASVFAFGGPAAASVTQDMRIEGSADFLEGKFYGAGLNGNGELVPGNQISRLADIDDAAYLISFAVHKDKTYFGAGYPASIAVYDGKTASILAKFPREHTVSALASDGRSLFAATLPASAIYKVDDKGGTTPLVDFSTGSAKINYIWAMAANRGSLYAALGGHFPSIYKIDIKSGKKELLYKLESKSKNATALYVTDAGVYFGDDQGRVYYLPHGASRPSVLYAFSDAEIRMIAPMDKGLAIAVNSRRFAQPPAPSPQAQPKDSPKPSPDDRGEEPEYESGMDFKEAIDGLAQTLRTQLATDDDRESASPSGAPTSSKWLAAKPAPAPPPSAKQGSPAVQPQSFPAAFQDPFGKGEGNVFWMSTDGSEIYRLWYAPSSSVLCICPEDADLWVATSGPARLYLISKDGAERLMYESQSKDLSVVARQGKALVIGASNPASVGVMVPASSGEYVTKVFDAGFPCKIGRIEVTNDGSDRGDVLIRSGATSEVDSGWTEYRPAGGAGTLSSARFFQAKYILKSSSDAVRRIRISYRVQNQRPRLANLSAEISRAQDAQGEQTDIRFQWDISNLDNDVLLYQLSFQPPGSKSFLQVFDPSDRPKGVKNVNLPAEQFSDGQYRFRLAVSDEASNGLKSALTHEMDFPLLLIDQTPPSAELKREGGDIRWQAVDSASRVTRAEFRVDGAEWRALAPEDGLFDSQLEWGRVAVPVSAILLDFRFFDERENSRIYSLVLK